MMMVHEMSNQELCLSLSGGKLQYVENRQGYCRNIKQFVDKLTPAKKRFATMLLELEDRLMSETAKVVRDSSDIYNLLRYKIGYDSYEHFMLVCINQRNSVVSVDEISYGGIDQTAVDIRLLIGKAIERKATQIAVVHNHPSGNCKPSGTDDRLTDRINKACDIMGLRLIDHVIIGDNLNYYSYRDNGKL